MKKILIQKHVSRLFFLAGIFAAVSGAIAQTRIEVLVSNRGGHSVVRFDEAGNYLGDFISSGSGGLSYTEDILFHPDGSVLVTGLGNAYIKRYDGHTGAYLGNFSSGYSLDLPSKMSIGRDSLIYVTQWGVAQNKVVRFDLSGNFVDEFTSIGAPKGLGHTWDADGNFYISLFGATGGAGTVHKFDSSGNDLGTFINTTILDGPTSIWFDTNGDMLVEDWNAGKILRFDSTGVYVNTFVTGMTNPEGLAFLPGKLILVCDWAEDAVHLIDSNGIRLGYFCSTHLIDPNAVKVRASVTASVHEITKGAKFISPNIGEVFTISLPPGVTANARIRVLNVNGQVVEEISPSQTAIWNARNFPRGTYIVVLTWNGNNFFERILVN